jgi:mannobiose 2-epimerase
MPSDPAPTPAFAQDLRQRIEGELLGNILPFWVNHTPDEVNGGFFGALTNDLEIHNEVPRSAVLCSRILWTFATAYQLYGMDDYAQLAERAYRYLADVFWDKNSGGVYWMVNAQGQPVNTRKHSYAQAFAIYGLAEYYRATHDTASLSLAQELFGLLERHAHDDALNGYIECRGQGWQALAEMRLSDKDVESAKSMNTLLHIMEAYTNLLRIWEDVLLRARVKELIEIFLQRILDPQTHHLRLFFDPAWRSLLERVSYGHDIETSWLLVEAAEALGNTDILAAAQAEAVLMAQAVYSEGLDADGSLFYEDAGAGASAFDKHWWPQAEGVVGFYNAYQLSGQAQYAEAAQQCWRFIEKRHVDRVHGDWFKVLNRSGLPYADQVKVGPWECPYHHSRACFEMLARLKVQ